MSPIFIFVGIIAVIILWIIFAYNSFIRFINRAKEAWADIDVQLKRRYDLIPNLVNTVKGYAKHESSAFENVTKARAAAMGAGTLAEKGQAKTYSPVLLNQFLPSPRRIRTSKLIKISSSSNASLRIPRTKSKQRAASTTPTSAISIPKLSLSRIILSPVYSAFSKCNSLNLKIHPLEVLLRLSFPTLSRDPDLASGLMDSCPQTSIRIKIAISGKLGY